MSDRLPELTLPVELFRVDPLLLGISQESPDAPTFVEQLIGWSCGRWGFEEALKVYLERMDFARAAQCAAKLEEGRRKEAENKWRQRWREWHREQLDRLVALERERQSAAIAGGEESVLRYIDDFLREARAWLERYPVDVIEDSVGGVGGVTRAAIQEVVDRLEAAASEIGKVRRQSAERVEAVTRQLREVKGEFDQLFNRLLFESTMDVGSVAELVQRKLVAAVRGRDLRIARACLDALRRLANGGNPVEIEGEIRANDPAEEDVSKHVAIVASREAVPRLRIGKADLNAVVRRSLETTPVAATIPSASSAPAVTDTQTLEVWEWDEKKLRQFVERARSRMGAVPGSGEADHQQLLGDFLVGEGKLRLLQRNPLLARLFFADAFRWSIGAAVAGARDVRDGIARCLVVASWMCFSGASDSVATSEDLGAETQRRIETYWLPRLERQGLFGDQGAVAVSLGLQAAEVYYDNYLGDYLRRNFVAAESFLVGIVDAIEERAGVASGLLGIGLLRLIPEMAEEAQQRFKKIVEWARGVEGASEREADALTRVADLRAAVLNVVDESGLAEAVSDRLSALEGRLSRPAASGQGDVVHRLATPEIVVARDRSSQDSPRLVLLVESQAGRSFRNLRTTASLYAEADLPIGDVLEQPALMAQLQPGEKVEIAINVRGNVEKLIGRPLQLAISHVIVDASRVSPPLETRLRQFAVRLTRSEAAQAPANPYVVGVAVQRKESIYGRDDEINSIWRTLTGTHQDNVVLVKGERRLGKTTLLNAVERDSRFVGRYLIARCDLQVREQTDPRSLFRDNLAKTIDGRLRAARISVPEIQGRFDDSPDEGFKHWMRDLDAGLERSNKRVLVVLDELDQLVENQYFGELAVATLRAVAMAAKRVSFLLSGATETLNRSVLTREGRLFQLALEVKLSPLPVEAARKLVREPARDHYELTGDAVDQIVRETGRQPYLVQYVGHALFQRATARQLKYVTRLDVWETLVEDVIPKSEVFYDFKKAVPDEKDMKLLRALGRLQRGDRGVPVQDLQRLLGRPGDAAHREISDHLVRLSMDAPLVVERVVERRLTTHRYRLRVGLFALHLRYLQEGGLPISPW